MLGTAFERRLHFLAHSGLFRPWIRGFLLRLCGALPVYRREDDPTQTHRNEETFRACRERFDAGGVIVIFPEGTSRADRQVLRLKTGAARLALEYELGPGNEGRLAVIPAGLHFAERTAFRSDVVISVGERIDLGPFRSLANRDPEEAVRELTALLQDALEELILHVPRAELRDLVREIDRLIRDEHSRGESASEHLEHVRQVADWVGRLAEDDPASLYSVWRAVRSYRRKLEALDLENRALREGIEAGKLARASTRFVVGAALGLPLAVVGTLVNYVPYRLSGILGGVFAGDPTRIAFARIAAGLVLFPAWYAGLFVTFVIALGWPPEVVVPMLVAGIPLGLFARSYARRLRREGHRIRVVLLAATHRRLVARLRGERRALLRLLREAGGYDGKRVATNQTTPDLEVGSGPKRALR